MSGVDGMSRAELLALVAVQARTIDVLTARLHALCLWLQSLRFVGHGFWRRGQDKSTRIVEEQECPPNGLKCLAAELLGASVKSIRTDEPLGPAGVIDHGSAALIG